MTGTPKRVRPFPLAELPRVARAQAQAARLLASRLPATAGREWPDACRALGGEVTLALREIWALPARELPSQARGAAVELRLGGGRWALVVVEGRLAPRLARAALGLGGGEPELAAARSLTLAEEGALEFLVAAACGEAADVAGFAGETAVASRAHALGDGWLAAVEARLRTPVGEGWVRLLVPKALELAAERPATGLSPAEVAARLGDARVALTLELGRTSVGRGELAALAVGDVVVFERHATRDGTLMLRLGRGAFEARREGQRLTIESGYRLRTQGAASMEQEPSSPSEGASDELLRELPVEVVCELGRVSMSGRELVELKPGAVIPAGRPLSGPVDLTVGGRIVARGELVDVEGEIGVRITQLID